MARVVLPVIGLFALLGAVLPGSSARADPAPGDAVAGEAPTRWPIEHVVVIFQENRSFDHYFGTYPIATNPSGQPRFVAAPGTPPVDGLTPALLTANPNTHRPFRFDPGSNGLGVMTCSQDHGYRAEQRAANAGLMNRFVQALGKCPAPDGVTNAEVMGYFDGNSVTGLWNYAQHFSLNDHSFGTSYGPSTLGAINLVSGDTSHALAWNPDGTPTTVGDIRSGTLIADHDPLYEDCGEDVRRVELTGKNIGDLLNAGESVDGGAVPVTWGWFEGGFAPQERIDDGTEHGKAVCTAEHANILGNSDEDYEPHHEPFQYYASTANPHHLPPLAPEMIGRDDQANHQYDLSDFWSALDAHNMPAVSFLKPPGYQDGHPGRANSDPLDEQHFVVDTINRIEAAPEWESTAIVIAYDDSDGWYDHKFPPNVHNSNDAVAGAGDGLYPTGPANTFSCMGPAATVENARDRCGYGPRLPLLVISPFAKQNYVDDTVTDQTSVLRFIEDNWNLGRIGGSSFDDDVEGGLLNNMFRFDAPAAPPVFLQPCTGTINHLPVVTAGIQQANPRTNATLSLSVARSDDDLDTSPTPSWPCPAAYRDSLTDHYQWQRQTDAGWADIPGETQSTLDLSKDGIGNKGDQLRAQVTVDDGIQYGTPAFTDAVTVANTPPGVSVVPSSRSVQYSDPLAPMSVTSSDDDGDPVALSAVGLPPGIALTDNGEIAGNATGAAGHYDASVLAFDGSDWGTAPVVVDVTKENASVLYNGGLLFSTDSPDATTADVTLRAQVSQADDGNPGDLANATVRFDLSRSTNYSGTPDLSVVANADANGVATETIESLVVDNWTVVVRIDPDNGYFAGPEAPPVVVTVYRPSPGAFVTGGGWVVDPSYLDKPVAISSENEHGSFGFTVKLNKSLAPAGHAVYVFRGADGYDYIVKSNSWQAGGLAIEGTGGSFSGKANVSVIDPATGALLPLGGGNFSYRIDVTDGDPDRYALSLYTSGGSLYHRVGTLRYQLELGGGNVVVHSG